MAAKRSSGTRPRAWSGPGEGARNGRIPAMIPRPKRESQGLTRLRALTRRTLSVASATNIAVRGRGTVPRAAALPGPVRGNLGHLGDRQSGNPAFGEDQRSMSERVPMTKQGYDKLEADLRELKTVDRPQIVKEIEV